MLLNFAELPTSANHLAEAEAIVQQLWCWPLVVRSAGALIATGVVDTLAALQAWLEANSLNDMKLDYANPALFFARVMETQPPETQALFETCGAFAQPRLRSEALKALGSKDAIRRLNDLALITWPTNEPWGEMHPLVHDYAVRRLRASPQRAQVWQRFTMHFAAFAQQHLRQHALLFPELPNLLAAADYAHTSRDWESLHHLWKPVSGHLWAVGDHLRFAHFAERCLDAERARADLQTEIAILLALSWIGIERQDAALVETRFAQAEERLLLFQPNCIEWVRLWRYRGRWNTDQRQWEAAESCLAEAERRSWQLGPTTELEMLALALIRINQAHLSYVQNALAEALTQARDGLVWALRANTAGHDYLPGSHMEVGDLSYLNGDLITAEVEWTCAMGDSQLWAEDSAVAAAHTRLAWLGAKRGEMDKALEHIRRARHLYGFRGLVTLAARADGWLALLEAGQVPASPLEVEGYPQL